MININFVPEDYVQVKESYRTNKMYLLLLVITILGVGGSFMTIRVRQRALNEKEALVAAKMAEAKEAISKFEELQRKREAMMKTALTTAELLEPMPRGILVASLTNNLPAGASLLGLNMVQKMPTNYVAPVVNQYQSLKTDKPAEPAVKVSPERLLETQIGIEGIAPSDLQVAEYIKRLIGSPMFDNVVLIESKEHKYKDTMFRQFKLQATVNKNVQLTKENIDGIKAKEGNAFKRM